MTLKFSIFIQWSLYSLLSTLLILVVFKMYVLYETSNWPSSLLIYP